MNDTSFFVLLIAMLIYRTLDVFTAQAKLTQAVNMLHSRFSWSSGWFSRIRTLRKLGGVRARRLCVLANATVRLQGNFVDALMLLCITLIASVLLITITFSESEYVVSLAVAVATLAVSLFASSINLLVEHLKLAAN